MTQALLAAAVSLAADVVQPAAARHGLEVGDLPGIPAGIADVAHDEDGFLWVASEEGLFRFDGTEFVRTGGRVRLQQVMTGPERSVVAHAFGGTLHEARSGSLRPIARPDGSTVTDVEDAVFDGSGNLWALSGSTALRRDRSGAWSEITPRSGSAAGIYLRSIAPRRAGGVYVGTFDGRVYAVNPPEPPGALASGLGGMVQAIVEDSAGRVFANIRGGPRHGVVRIAKTGVELLAPRSGRPTSLVVRRDCVWSSWDDGVVALRAGAPPEVLLPVHGFPGGGSLHVDHEGTLWATSFSGGLHRYPEPDTALWTAAVGLPHAAIRQVIPGGGTRWASAWAGPLRFDASSQRWLGLEPSGVRSFDLVYGSARSGFWTSGQVAVGTQWRGVLARWNAGRLEAASAPSPESPWVRGALAPDGRLVLAYGSALVEIEPGEAKPRRIGTVPDAIDGVAGFAISPAGELAAAGRNGPLCRLSSGAERRWSCAEAPRLEAVMALTFVDDRTLWVASETEGLLSLREGETTRTVLDETQLGSRTVVSLAPSPKGGFWVVGRVSLLRVEPDGDGARVVERITAAQGLPRWWLSTVAEDDDGTLWVAALPGIARIPRSVREAALPPPSVRVTRVSVAGEAVPLDVPVRTVAGRDAVDVRWAALSYRDPTRIRHRFRLRPDDAWTQTDAPHLTFVAAAAGRYPIEVGSSRDGVTWVTAPVPIELRVTPPWYARPWVWSVGIMFGAVIGYAAHRLRLAHLVRLERQRTQIAMDLHDDLGATLGSIGLLAAVASEDGRQGTAGRRALDRIAEDARDAAASLADIVWSLRPGSETLDRLVLALRERGTELAPNGQVRVRVEAGDSIGRVPLALAVRRNVQWIAVEAMRNAIRHASPGAIDVRLEPEADRWRLSVSDDGDGWAGGPNERARGGMGLENMKRRAEAIGGTLEVRATAPRGTTVSVRFRADGRRPRMIDRWRRGRPESTMGTRRDP